MDAKRDEEGVFTIRFKKPNAWGKIKQAWDENPMLVVVIGTGAVTALGKLIDAAAGVQSKRAYAKRMNNSKKQGDEK
jgi:hypothetical protein